MPETQETVLVRWLGSSRDSLMLVERETPTGQPAQNPEPRAPVAITLGPMPALEVDAKHIGRALTFEVLYLVQDWR